MATKKSEANITVDSKMTDAEVKKEGSTLYAIARGR